MNLLFISNLIKSYTCETFNKSDFPEIVSHVNILDTSIITLVINHSIMNLLFLVTKLH
jgi:hypothetical protein